MLQDDGAWAADYMGNSTDAAKDAAEQKPHTCGFHMKAVAAASQLAAASRLGAASRLAAASRLNKKAWEARRPY